MEIPQVGERPNENYEKGTWNEEPQIIVSKEDTEKTYIYTFKKVESKEDTGKNNISQNNNNFQSGENKKSDATKSNLTTNKDNATAKKCYLKQEKRAF